MAIIRLHCITMAISYLFCGRKQIKAFFQCILKPWLQVTMHWDITKRTKLKREKRYNSDSFELKKAPPKNMKWLMKEIPVLHTIEVFGRGSLLDTLKIV